MAVYTYQQVREYRDAVLAVSPWEGRISALVVAGGSANHHVMNAFLANIHAQFSLRYCIMFVHGAGAHISHDLVVPEDMHVELFATLQPGSQPG